ncbi:MAG TPA: replication-relaxation family protein, partial [Chloroflexota bacterium]
DQDVEFSAIARRLAITKAHLAALVAELPYLTSMYSLVADIALAGPGRPELLAWEYPWRRSYWSRRAKVPRSVRLPAYVSLGWDNCSAAFLLVYDSGNMPLKAHRSMLVGLAGWRAAGGDLPTTVVHTTSVERAHTWKAVMDEIGRQHGGEPLPYVPFVPEALDDDLRLAIFQRGLERGHPAAPNSRIDHLRLRRPWSRLVMPANTGRSPEFDVESVLRLSPGHRAILDLVSAHPFLSTTEIGRFLGWEPFMAKLCIDGLLRWQLLRVLGPGEAACLRPDDELLETTLAGLRVMAAQHGVSLAFAARWRGLAGGGPAEPLGPRRSLLRYLAHTRGVNEFFVRLSADSLHAAGKLVEWQNAHECCHWPVHPDGYGTLRVRGRDRGFFLEFDRGTMSARDYFAKLSAYYDYRDSRLFERDYDGFPTILFVTTADPGERRFARAAKAAAVVRGAALPMFLTTNWRITNETNPAGLLGAIWRTPTDPFNPRRSWPSGANAPAMPRLVSQ